MKGMSGRTQTLLGPLSSANGYHTTYCLNLGALLTTTTCTSHSLPRHTRTHSHPQAALTFSTFSLPVESPGILQSEATPR